MKRLLISLFLLITNLSIAQHNLGFRLGVNAANQAITNDPVGHYSALIFGPVMGLIASRQLSRSTRVQYELIFTTKGQLDRVTVPYDKGYSFRERVHYIEVPLSLSFDLGKTKNRGMFIPAGLYYAFALGGKRIYTDNNTGQTETGRVVFSGSSSGDYDLPVKHGDVGVSLGLGYQLRNLIFDFTYNIGLKNIHPKLYEDDNLIVKNLYLRFGAIYMLDSKTRR